MKKITLLVLALLLVLTLFSCQQQPEKKVYEPDTWDGSVAEAFEGGEGTEESPYLIATGSQLAYLAKSVNDGSSYEDKYISLLCDIDLNNIEWTPIGNGVLDLDPYKYHSFDGNFDGNGHTIKNLYMSDAIDVEYTNDDYYPIRGFTGLFGMCRNVNLQNLNISNASITVKSPRKYNHLYSGIVVGIIGSSTQSSISNVNVSDSKITLLNIKTEEKQYGGGASIGGIIGRNDVGEGAQTKISHIQSDLKISCAIGSRSISFGGIIGIILNSGKFECNNFASYLSCEILSKDTSEHLSGAIGYIQNSKDSLKISNGFSNVKTNLAPATQHPNAAIQFTYSPNAIAGEIIFPKLNNTTQSIEFNNLFGCVSPLSSDSEFTEPMLNLYSLGSLPENAEYIENNCKGVVSLPDNHGFDSEIWNLDDLSNPALKFSTNK